MPRQKRITLGGYLYHVLNRSKDSLCLFGNDHDFQVFEQVLKEGQKRHPIRICGYCILRDHWHLLLWPERDGDLSDFMRWITLTHTQRFHAIHGTVGKGQLYRERYKSFPVQKDTSYLRLMQYIESHPVRTAMVLKAEDWPWSSFYACRTNSSPVPINDGPISLPKNWRELVHSTINEDDLWSLKNIIKRGAPLGDADWTRRTAKIFNLESTLKPLGRPKK